MDNTNFMGVQPLAGQQPTISGVTQAKPNQTIDPIIRDATGAPAPKDLFTPEKVQQHIQSQISLPPMKFTSLPADKQKEFMDGISQAQAKGLPKDQIKRLGDMYLQKYQQSVTQAPEAPKKDEGGLFSRIGADLKGRYDKLVGANQMVDEGSRSKVEFGGDILGQLAGGVGDILGEGIKTVAKGAFHAQPEMLQQGEKAAGNAVLQTPVVQAGLKELAKGKDAYDAWKGDHPNEAMNLENIVNVASLLPIGKGAKVVEEGGEQALKATGELAGKAAVGLEAKTAQKGLDATWEALKPELSKAGLAARQAENPESFTKSMFGKVTIKPTEGESKMVQAAKDIIDVKKTPAENIAAVEKGIGTEAQSLRSSLEKEQGIWSNKSLQGKLDQIKMPITMKSDVTQSNIFNNFKKAVLGLSESANKKTIGLLDVRQGFDKLAKEEFGPTIYDKTNPVSKMIHDFRNTINDFTESKIATKEGKQAFLDSKAKQSSLFDAIDNLKAKTPKLDQNLIERVASAIKAHPVLGTLGAVGVATHPAALLSMAANPAALTALATYGVYKLGKKVITSDMFTEGLTNILKATEKTLNPEEGSAIKSLIEKLSSQPVGLSIKDVSAEKGQAAETFQRLQTQKLKLLDQGLSESSPQVRNIIKAQQSLGK